MMPSNAKFLTNVEKCQVQSTCDDLRVDGTTGWLVVGEPVDANSDMVGVYELANLPEGYGVNAQSELVKFPEGKAIGQYGNTQSWV